LALCKPGPGSGSNGDNKTGITLFQTQEQKIIVTFLFCPLRQSETVERPWQQRFKQHGLLKRKAFQSKTVED